MNTNTSERLLKSVIEGIQEKKGRNITILDLRKIEHTIADYFVICSGDSNVHVDAVADSVEEEVQKRAGEKPHRVEGRRNAEWILIDYMDVVVHVFQKPIREFFSLETLWADADRTDVEDNF